VVSQDIDAKASDPSLDAPETDADLGDAGKTTGGDFIDSESNL
jgi:hypothetical protein